MKDFSKSIVSLLLKGLFYLSLIITILGCGMLFQFLTSDRSRTYWREGSLSSFIWAIVIGVVGAIVASYLSSKLNSSKKQNNTTSQEEKQLPDK